MGDSVDDNHLYRVVSRDLARSAASPYLTQFHRSTKGAETFWSTTTCWSTKEAETITITSQYEKDYTSYIETVRSA